MRLTAARSFPRPAATSIALAVGLIAAAILLCALRASAASGASATSATSDRAAAANKRHVIVIGIDGTRWDKLRSQIASGAAPNLASLAKRGFLSPVYIPSGGHLDQTLSAPSWNTILRGVWENKHHVDSNDDCDYVKHSYQDFLTRLEDEHPSLKTFAASTWANITTKESCGPYISGAADRRFHRLTPGGAEDDAITGNATARYIRAHNPNASFVHLDEVDEAGHADGGASPQYLAAIAKADRQVGKILDAIKARRGSEHWTVIVTTDHGHTDAGGHGSDSAAERTSWILGASLGRGRSTLPRKVLPGELRSVDIAPTVFAALGYPKLGRGRLDGRAIGSGAADPFDTVASRLGGAVDETPDAYSNGPGQLYGFTHKPPTGWHVVNGGNHSGGITEWQGWSFTTDPFWTAADRGQGREEFGAGRGVIAVADGDEFNDSSALSGSSRKLDTTLVSPAYDVRRTGTAHLSFAERYRQEGGQRGTVSVSFDGHKQRIVLRRHSSVASHTKRLAIKVPRGARKMRVRWHYVGSNDWYWAIDGPHVRTGR